MLALAIGLDFAALRTQCRLDAIHQHVLIVFDVLLNRGATVELKELFESESHFDLH